MPGASELVYQYSTARDDLSESTLRAYRQALRSFFAWCGEQEQPIEPLAVTSRQLSAWRRWLRRERHNSRGAMARNIAALKSFYGWLCDAGHLGANPCAELRAVSQPRSRVPSRELLTDEEVRRVINVCRDSRADVASRDSAIIHLMAYAGLRVSELLKVWWEHVRWRDQRLTLDIGDDVVLLHPEAERALRSWMAAHPRPGGPLFVSLSNTTHGRALDESSLRKMIRRRFRQARIAGARKTADSLRAGYIAKLIDSGLSPREVQTLARHTDLASTMQHYRRPKNPGAAGDVVTYAEPETG